MNLILAAVVIISAIWVYKDSKKYQMAGVDIMSPRSWTLFVILLWFIAFPLYLILKFFKYRKGPQQVVDKVQQGRRLNHILYTCFAIFAVFFIYVSFFTPFANYGYQVPELGIQFPVPDDLKNLTYKTYAQIGSYMDTPGSVGAEFSTKELGDDDCLGEVVVVKDRNLFNHGQAEDAEMPAPVGNTNNVYYYHPQEGCGSPEQNKLIEEFKDSLSQINEYQCALDCPGVKYYEKVLEFLRPLQEKFIGS